MAITLNKEAHKRMAQDWIGPKHLKLIRAWHEPRYMGAVAGKKAAEIVKRRLSSEAA